jgi:hypothetical protein
MFFHIHFILKNYFNSALRTNRHAFPASGTPERIAGNRPLRRYLQYAMPAHCYAFSASVAFVGVDERHSPVFLVPKHFVSFNCQTSKRSLCL